MRTLLALLATLTLATALHAQSLADAAKAAAKNSGALAQPAKVYTNKDLKEVPAPVVTAVPSEEVREADDPKKDEAYWKRRMRALQAQVSNDAMVLPTFSKLIGIYTVHHPYPETTETRSPVKDLSVPYFDGKPYVSRWFQSKTPRHERRIESRDSCGAERQGGYRGSRRGGSSRGRAARLAPAIDSRLLAASTPPPQPSRRRSQPFGGIASARSARSSIRSFSILK